MAPNNEEKNCDRRQNAIFNNSLVSFSTENQLESDDDGKVQFIVCNTATDLFQCCVFGMAHTKKKRSAVNYAAKALEPSPFVYANPQQTAL